MRSVPAIRLREANDAPVRPEGRYVLYWMTAYRRARWNFALERAVEWSKKLGRPLLVLEALRCRYPHASDRFHRFIIDGMRDNALAFEAAGVRYHPYVEPDENEGKGLLEALAERACVVVTDDYPTFFLPHMVEAAASRLGVLLEVVDSCGLLPLHATDRDYPTAYGFRRFLQRELKQHLDAPPTVNPLSSAAQVGVASLPRAVSSRWPRASKALLEGGGSLAAFPIDHEVAPLSEQGGTAAGRRRLHRFLRKGLPDYAEERNQPEQDATSRLSPYLHFGQVSTHEIFDAVMRREGWTRDDLAPTADGKRSGWWGVSESVEGFLDQLITWRELGFNYCHHRDDATSFQGLPDWAQATLTKHAADPRPHVYDRDTMEQGKTYDPLWNAAMGQLRRDGRIHNYLRMLWGKKVLEWSRDPLEALETLLYLNDRWAVDGRDPNSYAGIGWCLGRYDRPWGPEREVFGTIRYMSSVNTARKVRVNGYVRQWL